MMVKETGMPWSIRLWQAVEIRNGLGKERHTWWYEVLLEFRSKSRHWIVAGSFSTC